VATGSGSSSASRTWSLELLDRPLTHGTTCWWCGASVFFHRNEYGGCALFDELGWPWPIHACWEERRQERSEALEHVSQKLDADGFDGRIYKPRGRHRVRPLHGEVVCRVVGYVEENQCLYQTPRLIRLRAGRGCSSAPLAKVEISDGAGAIFPFLVDHPTAQRLDDYQLVTARGIWVRRALRWVLLATAIQLHQPLRGRARVSRPVRCLAVRSPIRCRHCGRRVPASDTWGFDPEYRFECSSCGSARRRMSASDFARLCRRVARTR